VLPGETYTTSDINNYGIYEGHIETEDALTKQFTQLLIFPEELSDEWTVNDFYYSCSNKGLLDNSYQLLLDYQLPPEDFKAELERLQNLSVTFEGQTRQVAYDTESFRYPAYVTAYEKSGNCEFALIDEENHRIIAVLAAGERGSLKEDLFPSSIPQYEGAIDRLGFSIYQFEIGDSAVTMGVTPE
jgi:hypothetical protein